MPNRYNIVLSQSLKTINGAEIAATFDDALELCDENESIDQVFIIGGAQIYEMALTHPKCDTLFVTKVFRQFECDAHFQKYKPQFSCTYASNIWVNNNGNCAFFRYKKLTQ